MKSLDMITWGTGMRWSTDSPDRDGMALESHHAREAPMSTQPVFGDLNGNCSARLERGTLLPAGFGVWYSKVTLKGRVALNHVGIAWPNAVPPTR